MTSDNTRKGWNKTLNSTYVSGLVDGDIIAWLEGDTIYLYTKADIVKINTYRS